MYVFVKIKYENILQSQQFHYFSNKIETKLAMYTVLGTV